MKWLRFFIILLLATVLNAGLLNLISVGNLNIKPDLLLVLLVFFAVNCNVFNSIIISFAIGFAADISGSSMGPYMISFGLLGTLISQMRNVIIMKRMVYQGFAIFVTGLITGILALLLTLFQTNEPALNLSVILLTALYSGLIGAFVWPLFSWILPWLKTREYRFGRVIKR